MTEPEPEKGGQMGWLPSGRAGNPVGSGTWAGLRKPCWKGSYTDSEDKSCLVVQSGTQELLTIEITFLFSPQQFFISPNGKWFAQF